MHLFILCLIIVCYPVGGNGSDLKTKQNNIFFFGLEFLL